MAEKDDFLKEEELILLDGVRVNGKAYEKGATVKVSGNDKAQLLASNKAKRKEQKEEKK